MAASTTAPMPRAIAHPRDDILPETLPVKVLDIVISLLLLRVRGRTVHMSARSRDYMRSWRTDKTSSGPDGRPATGHSTRLTTHRLASLNGQSSSSGTVLPNPGLTYVEKCPQSS